MSAHDEAVEAAARALRSIQLGKDEWDELPEDARMVWRGLAAATNNAYLRHLRAAGYVVTKVGGEAGTEVPIPETPTWQIIGSVGESSSDVAEAAWQNGWANGFNTCRAEMLANAIDGDAPCPTS